MIFWITVWCLLLVTAIILSLQEKINGSIECRFWIIIILCFALIIIPIFMGGAYYKTLMFCKKFELIQSVAAKLTTYDQEYAYFGTVLEFNRQLGYYQSHLRPFIPYYKDIWTLKPIQLKYFNMTLYNWDEA